MSDCKALHTIACVLKAVRKQCLAKTVWKEELIKKQMSSNTVYHLRLHFGTDRLTVTVTFNYVEA